MANEDNPTTNPVDDNQLPVEQDDREPHPDPVVDPPVSLETAPLIKVDAESRGKRKQAGRRREKSAVDRPPDFGGLELPADDPEQTPDPTETTVSIVDIRATPSAARSRAGQRKASRETRPERIDFGSLPAPAPESGPSEEDTESEASQTRTDSQAEKPLQAVSLPTAPRSVTARRRKASPKSWSIVIAICGVSIGAVVFLLVFLLGRPPADDSPAVRETASLESNESSSITGKSGSRPRRSTAERSGVRGYSEAEAAQRRQGLDSFAALGRSEEVRLHRDGTAGLPHESSPGGGGRIDDAPLDLTKGLLAHWSFETKRHDQAADDSLHERPASLDGKPASTATGARGLALRLDGKDDCLRVPDGLLKGAAGTISLWLRTRDRAEPKLFITSAGKPAVFCLRLQGGQLIVGGPQAGSEPITAAVPLWSNSWQHVAVTWQSGGEVVLYLDGLPLGQQAAGRLPDPVGVVVGGDAAGGACSAFDVDEIRLFDRTVSSREIAELAARQ